MPGTMPEERKKPVELTLNQDDFIEYILKNTDDLKSEFRVYVGDNYILVGIDREKVTGNPAT